MTERRFFMRDQMQGRVQSFMSNRGFMANQGSIFDRGSISDRGCISDRDCISESSRGESLRQLSAPAVTLLVVALTVLNVMAVAPGG